MQSRVKGADETMSRSQRIQVISQIARMPNAFDELEARLADLSRADLSAELLYCGIIPESFQHDSAEEKLWAKYCDILLSKVLNHLNVKATVIRARGDSADVLGTTDDYTIVGDAKAFRMSRTAKNQKDFKVSALDDWRRGNTFACLIAPLYQFPRTASQIYAQSEAKNVILLSYIHLKFLMDYPPQKSLAPLWKAAGSLTVSKDARIYWEKIDDTIISLVGERGERLKLHKRLEIERTMEIGYESVTYWQAVIEGYYALSREDAIARLIKAEKVDQKIQVIQKMMADVSADYE